MYITSREKNIIDLIIKTSGKHTAVSLADHLNVSVRTIQRDLKGVEKILNKFVLHLKRDLNQGFKIEGKNEQIFRLIQHLLGMAPVDQTPQEKKLQLLIALLQEESYKIQALAVDLGVSITTLTTYLDELADWLTNFNVVISRKRGVGVDLFGSETNKRKALANYFLHHFHEELIESLFLLENGKGTQEVIFEYFHSEYLYAVDRIVNAALLHSQQVLADSDYVRFIVHICITMQRTKDQFLLDDGENFLDELNTEYNLIKEIGEQLESLFSLEFSKNDFIFLAVILKGSKLQGTDVVSYDSVVLSKRIKNLIQHVSSQIHVDLTNDFSLYQGLLAHMEPSLYRMKQQMGLFNPLTEEISRKYPVLFMAVKNSIEMLFPEIEDFPDDEIAFIVLHFGSALVMQEEEISIKALVVCPTGIGTSKMLASRIKKEILGIDSIEIKSIKEIKQQYILKSYDLIISTVRLPFIDIDYILVSPLLSEENIITIKNFIRNNIETLTKNKNYLKSVQNKAAAPSVTSVVITDVLQSLKDVHESIEGILKNFCVYQLSDLKEYERIIEEMVEKAKKEELLTHPQDVVDALMNRERKGGLGIPGTDMALFHCRYEKVRRIIFQVTHLEKPIQVRGMDGNPMDMRNLLLMVAPEELSVREQEIVSLVSTSLIENKEAIMIFSSGNEEMIRTRLETIFLDYLYTNIIRE